MISDFFGFEHMVSFWSFMQMGSGKRGSIAKTPCGKGHSWAGYIW